MLFLIQVPVVAHILQNRKWLLDLLDRRKSLPVAILTCRDLERGIHRPITSTIPLECWPLTALGTLQEERQQMVQIIKFQGKKTCNIIFYALI